VENSDDPILGQFTHKKGKKMDQTALEDTLNIQQLYARYSDAIMRYDHDAFGSCWCDDGCWLLLGKEYRGKEAIVAAYANTVAATDFVMHLALSPLIALTGDTARVRSQVQEIAHFTNGDGMLLLGNYNDVVQKVDGSWLFADRRISLRYSGPFAMDANMFMPLMPVDDKPFA
jgi:uncharacterized protein (TIGR02246 family)